MHGAVTQILLYIYDGTFYSVDFSRYKTSRLNSQCFNAFLKGFDIATRSEHV